MTDLPQWALDRARELAAMWNDPGQGEAIARALAEAAPGWQPIETVPRDKSWFLAYEDGAIYKCRVFLVDDDDGTVAYAADCGQPTVDSPEPTHWMPLPAPPEVG